MAENVHVVVRCRPMNSKEIDMKSKNILKIDNCAVHLENPNDLQAPPKSFTFDSAYDQNAPTEAIYHDICYSLVESVLEGYNSTIFAYGQTGCGKSHTMQGPSDLIDINKNFENQEKILSERGIISRSFEHIFEAIAVSIGIRYLAFVSYLEIYNENIRDLLNPNISCSNLQLKEIPGEGVVVQNLSTHTVHNSQECENLFLLGAKNRMVGATLMNAGSSRSHSIFTINLEQISTASKSIDDGTVPNDVPNGVKKGKLNLVDLAGSERQTKTGATGDRLKEATKINLSLSALGNVISALVDGKTKHIPYRDAKLTRLLQDSLGGNTKTLMIACVSPSGYNYDETLSTLRYASRAKNIHNKPKINEDPKDAMLREYQEEINKLKSLLNINTTSNTKFIENLNFNNEKEKLRLKYEEEVTKLKTEHDIQKQEKEELYRNMEEIKAQYEEKLNNLYEENQQTIVLNKIEDGSFNQNSKLLIEEENFNKYNNHIINNDAVIERLQMIKNALIGGEKSDDVHLKEKRIKRKIDAQKRLSALAHALSRVEQNEDRDFLQDQYTSIQQELQVKTDALKKQRQKVRTLEREVTDLQAEFQLDRADYLETIRRLEKNVKFYQHLIEIALPLLRKEGRFWDIDQIRAEAVWNDDLKKWKFSDEILSRKKLPPAVDLQSRNGRESTSLTAPGRLESSSSIRSSQNESLNEFLKNSELDLNSKSENFNNNDNLINHNNLINKTNHEEQNFLMKGFMMKAQDDDTEEDDENDNDDYDDDDDDDGKDHLNEINNNDNEFFENDKKIIIDEFDCHKITTPILEDKKLQNADGNSIVDSYFRPRRANELIHQSRAYNSWKDYRDPITTNLYKTNFNLSNNNSNIIKNNLNGSWTALQQQQLQNYSQLHQPQNNLLLNSPEQIILSKTWNGNYLNDRKNSSSNLLGINTSNNDIIWDFSNHNNGKNSTRLNRQLNLAQISSNNLNSGNSVTNLSTNLTQ